MKRQHIITILWLLLTAVLLVGERVAAVDYTTPVPLDALCGDTYFGQAGCLYPGSNQPPSAYAAELTTVSNQLAGDSQVVVLGLGMSMMQNASNGFMQTGYASGGDVSPAFRFINGAIGSKQQNWVDPNNSVWNRGVQALSGAGLNATAVDVVIYHNAWAGPSSEPFPQHAITMKNSAQTTIEIIHDKYPNVQLILVLNRHYALSPDSKHPEPWAYEEGFSWKWLIEERINCTADCGPPIAWLANQWEPSWANFPQYYTSDGLHLSPGPGGGQYASAEIWRAAMVSSSYIAPWYLATPPAPTATPGNTSTPTMQPTPSNTPTVTQTAVPGVTATPSATPFPTVSPTPDTAVTPTATPDGSPWYCAVAPWRWPCPNLGW